MNRSRPTNNRAVHGSGHTPEGDRSYIFQQMEYKTGTRRPRMRKRMTRLSQGLVFDNLDEERDWQRYIT